MKPRKLDYEKIHSLRNKGHTYKQICDLTGASKSSIYKILRKQITQCGHAIRNRKAIKVINHILKNGGQVVDTIQRLRLSVSENTCRRVAVAHNINLKEYSHYLKENINWVVDGPNQIHFVDGYSHIEAPCKHCGHRQIIKTSSLRRILGEKCSICESKGAGWPYRLKFDSPLID